MLPVKKIFVGLNFLFILMKSTTLLAYKELYPNYAMIDLAGPEKNDSEQNGHTKWQKAIEPLIEKQKTLVREVALQRLGLTTTPDLGIFQNLTILCLEENQISDFCPSYTILDYQKASPPVLFSHLKCLDLSDNPLKKIGDWIGVKCTPWSRPFLGSNK